MAAADAEDTCEALVEPGAPRVRHRHGDRSSADHGSVGGVSSLNLWGTDCLGTSTVQVSRHADFDLDRTPEPIACAIDTTAVAGA